MAVSRVRQGPKGIGRSQAVLHAQDLAEQRDGICLPRNRKERRILKGKLTEMPGKGEKC